MTAQEYVDKLRILVPSAEYMKDKGIKDFRIDSWYPEYNIHRREVVVPYWNNEPILDFCYNFEFGKYYAIRGFHVSYPDFYDEDNKQRTDYYLFGSFETDGVAIDRETKEIVLLDHEDDYNTIFAFCALNSSMFLDAMFIMAQFQTECIFDFSNTLVDNIPVKEEVALKCAEVAGGSKYLEFYRVWLTCWEC